MASWEELPQDVLERIARRLAIEDFLAFGVVCTSCRSAAARETYNAKSKAPWIMTCVRNQIAEFFSPSRRRTYQVKLPGYGAQTLSTPGWLLVSKGGSKHRIFNPLSRVKIKLPSLEKYCHEPIHMIALSSSPSSSKNYTVMVSIRQNFQTREFAFHKSGEDAWTSVSPATDLPLSDVLQLIHYNEQFVALDTHNRIMTLDERECCMQLRLVVGQNFEGCPYLVECSGSLLVVWRTWRIWKTWETRETSVMLKSFYVFEVDLEKGTQEEVKSLGNATLFLSGNSSTSVELNAQTCLPGIKPNCIYFPEEIDKKIYCYSMEDGKVETYADAPSVYFSVAKWIQPDF